MLKKEVLRRKKDFNRIYGKGKSVGEKYVVMFSLKNGLGYNRMAFLASKKVGNSVQRNRARRLMKESFRNICEDLPEGYDIILIARSSIKEKKCSEVKASMKNAFRRMGLRRVRG